MSNLNQFQSFAKRNKLKTISNNKTVIYTRVSDVKQHDNTSLESQLKYCTEYAQKKVPHFENRNYPEPEDCFDERRNLNVPDYEALVKMK